MFEIKNFSSSDWLSNAHYILRNQRAIKSKKEEFFDKWVYELLSQDINAITSYNEEVFTNKYKALLNSTFGFPDIINKLTNLIVDKLYDYNNSLQIKNEIFIKLLNPLLMEVEGANASNNYYLNTIDSKSLSKIIQFIFLNPSLCAPFLNENSDLFSKAIDRISLKFFEDKELIIDHITTNNLYQNFKNLNLEWLHKKLVTGAAKFDVLKKIKNGSVNEEMKSIIFKELYISEYKIYNQLVHSDYPGSSIKQKPYVPLLPEIKNIICNYDGYESIMPLNSMPSNYEKGRAIDIDSETPIGYTILLPKHEINIGIVKVYGGLNIYDIKTRPQIFSTPSPLEAYLLNKGIAIVTLKLVDLLKLNVFQSAMPQDLHADLHESINKAYQILKFSPTKLHSSLKSFLDKDIYIYGASFGGRTAIKQIELYPDTFKGAISFNGFLSYEKSGNTAPESEWLCPTENIDSINNKIMIISNFDDNRVPLSVSLEFIEKAKVAQKGKFIETFFSPRGNPEVRTEITLKGHFMPKGEKHFLNIADAIYKFTTEDVSKINFLQNWRTLKAALYSNKNYKYGTVEERFISKAYTILKTACKSRDFKEAVLDNWDELYKPLYILEVYVDFINNGELKNLNNEIGRLKNNSILSDEIIYKTLSADLNFFTNYVEEKYNLKFFKSLDIDPANIITKDILNNFKDNILNDSSTASREMRIKYIEKVYKNNLILLNDEFFKEFNQTFITNKRLEEVKNNFIEQILLEKHFIQKTWRQAAKSLLHQKSKKNASEKLPNLPHDDADINQETSEELLEQGQSLNNLEDNIQNLIPDYAFQTMLAGEQLDNN